MGSQQDYSQLVAKAEKAVSGVKDPELRRIAFQKILDNLLSPASAQSVKSSKLRTGARSGTKEGSIAGKSPKRKRGGMAIYLAELIEEDFFKKPTTLAQVKAELENRGHHIPMTALSGPLQRACQKRQLRRQKVKTSEKKHTFAYSDW